MTEILVAAAASTIAAVIVTIIAMKPLIALLNKRGQTVPDVNKPGRPQVPRPAGPAILAGMIAGEMTLYTWFPINEILAVVMTTSLAFAAGLVDDIWRRGAWFKPLALAGCAAPILLLGAYDTNLAFPIFGEVSIPILYMGVVVMMIVITGNTINSIDVINGTASSFMAIATISLVISLVILGNYTMAAVALPLAVVSLAYYRYHRIPCRIFPGDSGALALGAMYGSVAIVGQIEVISAIALLPAIINSFLFLTGTKKIVEYRNIKVKSTDQTDDLKIKPTGEPGAIVTLVALLVAARPLSEAELGKAITKLAIISAGLALLTAFLTVIQY